MKPLDRAAELFLQYLRQRPMTDQEWHEKAKLCLARMREGAALLRRDPEEFQRRCEEARAKSTPFQRAVGQAFARRIAAGMEGREP